MINFFRKKREKLANDNNALKYARYAIGEIVLVVIGILIALSINNWNEERIEKKTLQNIYLIVVNDLKNDISDITNIKNIYDDQKPLYNKILSGELTREDYLNCLGCTRLIMGYPDLSIDIRGYNLLSNNTNITKTENDSLHIDIVQFYSKSLMEIKINEDLKAINFSDNYEHWKNNQSWFSDFITKRNYDGFIDYAVNSQDYKNKIAMIHLMNYSALLPQYEEFRNNAEALVKRIESQISK